MGNTREIWANLGLVVGHRLCNAGRRAAGPVND